MNEPAEKTKQNGFGLSIKNDAKGMEMIINTNPAANSNAKTPQFLFDSFYLYYIVLLYFLNPETKAPKSYSSSPKNYINNYPNLIKNFEKLWSWASNNTFKTKWTYSNIWLLKNKQMWKDKKHKETN